MTRVIILSFFIFNYALLGCTSDSSVEPKTHIEDNAPSWVKQFRKAKQLEKKKKPLETCAEYTSLSSTPNFPLKQLVLLKMWKHCPLLEYDATIITDFWLSNDVEELNFHRAALTRGYSNTTELILNKSKNWHWSSKQKEEHLSKLIAQDPPKKFKDRLQKELQKNSPRFIKNPKPKDYFNVANDFRRNRNFKKSRNYYVQILNSRHFSKLNKLKALKWVRKTYKMEKHKNMSRYLEASKKWADYLKPLIKRRKPNPTFLKKYHDAQIMHARALWTEVGQKPALKVLRDLEKKISKKYTKHEVFRLKGRMAQEKKDLKLALSWFKKARKQTARTQDEKERIYWLLAWTHKSLEQYSESNKILKKVLDFKWLTPTATSKYRYWLGQNLQDLNLPSEAQSIFENIISDYPYTYYGILAHRKQKKAIEKPNLSTNAWSDVNDLFEDKKIFSQFQWLVSLGETEYAKILVRKKFTKKIIRKNASLKLLKLFAIAGDYLKLYQVFALLPVSKQNKILAKNFHLIFPTPFLPQVRSAEKQFGTPAALTYSIMRQESAFDPKARSHADAFGLMQLLPRVANKTAVEIGWINLPSPEDLFEPDTIIPLGAAHLKKLLNNSEDQFTRAVASYNATPTAFSGWMKTRYHGDTIEFIEKIPYEETRNYIKLIMRNFIFYSVILGSENQMVFPEKLLHLQ